jgi:hypothetical protein
MGITTTAAGLLETGLTAFGVQQRQAAASAQNAALESRLHQEKLAETKRSIDRLDRVHQIVSNNIATAGARGISPASGSFKAINEEAYNKFDEDENADLLNLQYRTSYINQLEDVNDEESVIGAFGDIERLGTDFLKTTVTK